MKSAIFSIFFPLSSFLVTGQEKYRTYCNPIDIDYTYVAHNSLYKVSYRVGENPAVINFKGKYYMFVTRSYESLGILDFQTDKEFGATEKAKLGTIKIEPGPQNIELRWVGEKKDGKAMRLDYLKLRNIE